jgi:hypothetical protein
MKQKDLKHLIRESIKLKIAKLKETSVDAEKGKAQSLISVINDQANALNSLAKHARELYEETQYSELEKEAISLEMMRDQKLQKIADIKSRYGLNEAPKPVVNEIIGGELKPEEKGKIISKILSKSKEHSREELNKKSVKELANLFSKIIKK